jgi:hypothetical protein
VKERLIEAIKQRLDAKQILKILTPLTVDFKMKLLANQVYKGIKHDYALLVQFKGESFIEDPEDLVALLTQILAERKSDITVAATKGKVDGEIWNVVFIDFPKATKP